MKALSKKQQALKERYEREKKAEAQRNNLAGAAIEKWGVSDTLDALFDVADLEDQKRIREWAGSLLTINDSAIIIHPQSIAESDKINDFLHVLYPSHNEQQLTIKYA